MIDTYKTIFFTASFFSSNIHSPHKKQTLTPTHFPFLSPACFSKSSLAAVLGLHVGIQDEYDWLKAQSAESYKLRALINIHWARRRDRKSGGEVGKATSNSNAWGGTKSSCHKTFMLGGDAAAIRSPLPSNVDKTESSLEKDLGKTIWRMWEQFSTWWRI